MLCGPALGDQLCNVGDPAQIENGQFPARNFEDGDSSVALLGMGSQPGSKAPNTWRLAYENNFPLLSCKVTCHRAEQLLLLTLDCGEPGAQEPSRFFVHLHSGDMSAAPCFGLSICEAGVPDPGGCSGPFGTGQLVPQCHWLGAEGRSLEPPRPFLQPVWPSLGWDVTLCSSRGVFNEDPTYLDRARLLPWRPPINFVGK